ncbi:MULTISPECIES: SRPBCC domain-containing protein [unclassified Aeromicrobium]|uniref:SRPBCC domain-containing protein n=1 Tax=unclassified Aeromicrobium TaxID=2633570 RepID=UPI00396B093D
MSHTDVGEAVLEATPEEVFSALVDEAARTVWLPPSGMTGRFSWFDATPGGGYRMTLAYDDETTTGKSGENTDVVEVRFVSIDAPRLVAEEVEFVSDDPDFAGTMTMTWTLEPVREGTRVVITATDVPDGVSSEDHVEAFASTLAQLGAYVTRSRG